MLQICSIYSWLCGLFLTVKFSCLFTAVAVLACSNYLIMSDSSNFTNFVYDSLHNTYTKITLLANEQRHILREQSARVTLAEK